MIDNFYVAIDLIDHQPLLTVHGRWAGGTPHNSRTRDCELVSYSKSDSFLESTGSPLLLQNLSQRKS